MLRNALALAAPSCAVLVAIELALRLFLGAPVGYFDFLLPSEGQGLYEPNITRRRDWGRIPYMVRTDELGLRRTREGPPRSRAKGRIVAIGDSVTDGFMVDDEATFPFVMQELLDAELGPGWQVLNAARGGGSLPKELAILRRVALPLEPTIVLLTFVTNDISDLREEKHMHPTTVPRRGGDEELPLYERVGLWLATRTALGESLLRLYWETFIKKESVAALELGPERYEIPGGDRFVFNALRFLGYLSEADGIVHVEPFPPETQLLVDRYLGLLEEFVTACHDHGATPVLVYLPSYAQVYLPRKSLLIRDVLAQQARRLELDFLDLTPFFRQEGEGRVIHLAPLDYHPNPAGHGVMARAIFDFLRDRGLVH
jgi:lysophospholipase L1-like esterase